LATPLHAILIEAMDSAELPSSEKGRSPSEFSNTFSLRRVSVLYFSKNPFFFFFLDSFKMAATFYFSSLPFVVVFQISNFFI